MLIQARIARGLTQKELAQKLGLKEQQIQRYEANDYAKASLARLNQIIDVLKVKIGSKVDLRDTDASKRTIITS
ncbi:MAG: helix-turn-helix transcriptional regulator [bacterium]